MSSIILSFFDGRKLPDNQIDLLTQNGVKIHYLESWGDYKSDFLTSLFIKFNLF